MTPADWQQAERMAVAGSNLREVAERFGITHAAVRQRARREDWPTPLRLRKRRREALREEAREKALRDELLAPCRARLAAATDLQSFLAAFADYARIKLLPWLRSSEPPRSVREVKIYFDICRQASGLDGRRSQEDLRVVRPLGALTRGPLVIEAEVVPVDPLDGFVL